MRFTKLIGLLIASLSVSAGAEIIEHYKTKTFLAETVNVITPEILEITSYLEKDKGSLSKLYIKIDGLIFDVGDQIACEDNLSSNCERLMSWIEGAEVQFSLKDQIGKGAFNGTVFVNNENLRHSMLREGWYKFDYKVGRSRYDILIQKEAECKRKGIWRKVTYSVTDERCQ
jgi:hypothetical protein